MEVEENCHDSSSYEQEKGAKKNNHLGSPKIQKECVVDEVERWQTVTHNSYPTPQPDLSKSLGALANFRTGRRRQLVKEFIGLSVFEETINAIIADPPSQPVSPSEYVDNFCDSRFVPFMDRTEYNNQKHIKYPLHGGSTVQSYYKSQLDRGMLKARSEILDLNQPFRRSCSFTTPPDLAFKEPTGGY